MAQSLAKAGEARLNEELLRAIREISLPIGMDKQPPMRAQATRFVIDPTGIVRVWPARETIEASPEMEDVTNQHR